jgi:dimethylamine---corrinoid protein Co-methyltransferase
VGVGDPFGMAIAHGIASGMGGIRTAGDLVARMQMTQGMRIKEAKKYVADKLKISVQDVADPVVMSEVREELDIGRVNAVPRVTKGMDAKFRIADILGIDINCVSRFKRKVGLMK